MWQYLGSVLAIVLAMLGGHYLVKIIAGVFRRPQPEMSVDEAAALLMSDPLYSGCFSGAGCRAERSLFPVPFRYRICIIVNLASEEARIKVPKWYRGYRVRVDVVVYASFVKRGGWLSRLLNRA